MVTTIGFPFSSAMNKSLLSELVRKRTSRRDSLCHSCDRLRWSRRCQGNVCHIVHFPSARTDGSQEAPNLYYTVGVAGQCKQTLQRAPRLQTGMGPGIIMLQEKHCLHLWPDSGHTGFLLSQSRDVATRVRLSAFQEAFPIPKQCTALDPLVSASCTLFRWGIPLWPLHEL